MVTWLWWLAAPGLQNLSHTSHGPVRTSPTLAWEPRRSKAGLTHVLAGARPRAAGQ